MTVRCAREAPLLAPAPYKNALFINKCVGNLYSASRKLCLFENLVVGDAHPTI